MSDKKDNVVDFASIMKKKIEDSGTTQMAEALKKLNASTPIPAGIATSVVVNIAYAIGVTMGRFSQTSEIIKSAPEGMDAVEVDAAARGTAAGMVMINNALLKAMTNIRDTLKDVDEGAVNDLLHTFVLGLKEGVVDAGPGGKASWEALESSDEAKPEDGTPGTVH